MLFREFAEKISRSAAERLKKEPIQFSELANPNATTTLFVLSTILLLWMESEKDGRHTP
jgi:hypothetical protein